MPEKSSAAAREAKVTGQAKQLETYFNESAEDLKNIRSSSDASATSWRQEKLKYFDLLQQMNQQEQQAIARIAEYAKRMSNLKVDEGVAVSAGESLHQAVGCLKEVATTLRTASTFWGFMKQACGELAKPDTRNNINLWKTYPREKKFKRYNGDLFKNSVLLLFGGWKALEVVATEYRTALNAVSSKEKGFIKQNPRIEESRKLAKEMADKLLKSTGDADAKLKELDNFIQAEVAKLNAAA
jgi:hypothetical protein